MENYKKIGLSQHQFEMLQNRILEAHPDVAISDIFISPKAATAICIRDMRIRRATYQEGIYLHIIFPDGLDLVEILCKYDYLDEALHPATPEIFSAIQWDDEKTLTLKKNAFERNEVPV